MLELFTEEDSDIYCPYVKKYYNNDIPKIEDKSNIPAKYKKKVNLINNEITILKESDAIYSLEFYANLIDKVEMFIGVYLINTFYNIKNNGRLWKIDFKDLFCNGDFIPLISIQYNDIKFKFYGENIGDCYVEHAFFRDDFRRNLSTNNLEYIVNHQNRYKVNMNSERISMVNQEDKRISKCNFIRSLRFKFEKEYDIKYINVYAYGEFLTTLTKNDFIIVSDREFIVKNFYYKLFLYNDITLEFDQKIEGNVFLTTINFNLLRIHSNQYGLKWFNFERTINNSSEMEEKVMPKNDKICAISQQ